MDFGVQFYLIRHAPVEQKNIYTGWTDQDCLLPSILNADEFLDFSLDSFWFTSDLQRSMKTAHWLCKQMKIAPQLKLVPDLREQNFGDWEGQPYQEIYSNNAHLNWEDPAFLQPPNGESFIDVCTRVQKWLDDLLAAAHHSTYCIVAHAGSIRAILAHGLGLSPQQALLLQLEPGSISNLNYYAPKRGSASVSYINRIVFK